MEDSGSGREKGGEEYHEVSLGRGGTARIRYKGKSGTSTHLAET